MGSGPGGGSAHFPPRGASRRRSFGSKSTMPPPPGIGPKVVTELESAPVRQPHARVKRVLAVAGVAVVTFKVGVPLLRALGGFLFKRGKKAQPQQRAAAPTDQAGPSDDSWQVVATTAPEVPADLKEVFSTTLPCSVQDFYRRFVAGNTDFQKRLHKQLEGREDYTISPWKPVPTDGQPLPPGSACDPDDQNVLSGSGRTPFDYVMGVPPDSPTSRGYIRSVTLVQPKKPPQSVDAECVQRQQFCVFQGDVLIMAIVQNMLNIPFKDCFTVNTVWTVRPAGDGRSCTIKVNVKVNFVKGVLVGGIIRSTTMNANIAYWKKWLQAATVELDKPIVAAVAAPPVRGKGNAMFRSMHRGSGEVNGLANGGAADMGTAVAPLRRQLRVALVVIVVLLGVMHQVVLKKGLSDVQNLLRR